MHPIVNLLKDLFFQLGKVLLVLTGIVVACLVFWILLLLFYMYVPEDPGMDRAYNPVWSLDGSIIAFECVYYRQEDREMMEDIFDPPLRDICLINHDVSGLRRITQGRGNYSPILSPDRKSLAWWDGGKREVAILNLENGEYKTFPISLERMELGPRSGSRLEWSLDGQNILFQGCSLQLNVLSGRVISIPGFNAHWLCGYKAWSPDGKRLFSIERADPESEGIADHSIRIFGQDEQIASTVVRTDGIGRPSWNTAGTLIAWTGRNSFRTRNRLFISNATDGRTVEILLDENQECENPKWVSDQQQIYCNTWSDISLYSIEGDLSKMDFVVNQNQTYVINKKFYEEERVNWAPDGLSFLYQPGDGEILLVTLDGNQKKLVP